MLLQKLQKQHSTRGEEDWQPIKSDGVLKPGHFFCARDSNGMAFLGFRCQFVERTECLLIC